MAKQSNDKVKANDEKESEKIKPAQENQKETEANQKETAQKNLESEAKKLQRDSYIKTLEDLGVETKGLTDEQLLFKVVSELNKTNSKLISATADKEIKSVGRYTVGVTHKIEDKEFILRLFNLNVPNFYLHLFEDKDALLEDKEIWGRINKSKINPFKSVKEIIESRNRYHY